MAHETVRKWVDLNKADVAWFESQYPRGSITSILSMLLTKFREVTEHTPDEYAKIAAEALREELQSSEE